jgi:hypothetical protein
MIRVLDMPPAGVVVVVRKFSIGKNSFENNILFIIALLA